MQPRVNELIGARPRSSERLADPRACAPVALRTCPERQNVPGGLGLQQLQRGAAERKSSCS